MYSKRVRQQRSSQMPDDTSAIPLTSASLAEGLGFGFGVWGLGFGVWGLGCGVWASGLRVWGMGFGVFGLGFRVQGFSG